MENRRVNFSIKQVILGAFILLVVIPTMLIIYLAISQYSKNMSEQVILQKENLLNAIGINVEEQLKSFENMSMLIYYNTDAMDELDQYEKELSDQEVLLLDVQNILNSMVNSDKYVSAAIITINEGIFSAGQTYQDFDVLKETYEEQVYEEKGRIVYLPTQNLVTTYGVASRCFIIARAINSWDRTLGIQWLFISESVLSQNFDGYLTEGDSILTIVDKKGNVISSSNQDSIGTQINEMEIVETLALETYSVLEKYTDKKNYISSYIHDLKWTLIEENSYEAVYGSIHKIWNMGLILLMLFSTFSILMIYIIVTIHS